MHFTQFTLLVLSLLAQSVHACDVSACMADAFSDVGSFVNCDMCVCDGFEDNFGGSGTCSTSADDIFDCYIKYDNNDSTWTCTLRMQLGWIIAFVVLGCCFCCCVCGAGTWCFHRVCQDATSDSQENALLMRNTK
mmetsp:Transcript_25449/g.42893  ORF Transcript_25449/g.42893 Transcript_25449/m.42893 type:complete len:135 (+) Transcript_25449:38-442(+)